MKKIHIILFGLLFLGLNAQENESNILLLPEGATLQKSSLAHFELDSLHIYQKIDSIITNGIKNQSFPGAQI